MILVHQLSAISRNGWKYTRNRLTHPGLTNAAYNICRLLCQSGPSNQETIAKALLMDKSSVAKIVNKCVLDGLIERQINPDNRREYILKLTEKGYDSVKELIDNVHHFQEEALSVLNAEEKETFLSMIEKVRNHSDQLNND